MSEAFRHKEGPDRPAGDAWEVAAYWHGVFEDGDPTAAQYARFQAWLAADPSHREAYAHIERTWIGVANLGADEEILAMRRDALAAPQSRRARRVTVAAIAVSTLSAALAVGILTHRAALIIDPGTGEFATQVGERSNITLADGSTVVLNTASRIQVAFDTQVRRVTLLAGQAWFEVAKNQPRPFIVDAGGERVTAHGTAFDVRLEDHDRVRVILVEGRVSVEDLKTAPERNMPAHELLPGEQLIAAAARPATTSRVDLVKATSWRDGKIIFDDDTLATAVAEVNRYSAKKIILADAHLGTLRMSGVFLAGHSESFLETVAGNFPIKMTTNEHGQVVLTAVNEGMATY